MSNPGRVHPLVKVGVLAHAAAVLLWCLPPPSNAYINRPDLRRVELDISKFRSRTLEPIIENGLIANQTFKDNFLRWYMIPTGLWQSWDMFAPNPSNWDGWATAEIVYADGRIVEDRYSRVRDLPIPLRFLKERYRKFLERSHPESYAWMWPIVARALAYRNFDDPANPPVEVRLWRYWRLVQPPTKAQEPKYHSYNYFNYVVPVDELREAKGYQR
ncbi:MAG TPA: hypothetical protein VM328_02025 [Fimbriimonadaceae bacterium]|nr:hypothetical protein [Fimbriimonadaceae bacterium]